jgi:hypothetical protein
MRQFAEEIKLKGVVITSSPSFIPAARTEIWSPDVPLFTATAYFEPT